MLRPYAGTCQKDGSAKRRLLGVSEAVGTVLLLGISVTLAGGIALWTANIDEGEEGIYVDLWATVQGSDLVITHRGGDHLEGSGTRVIIMDSDGNQVITGTYSDLTGTVGETWGPGEELVIDISDTSLTNTFKVVVTTQRESGESVVLLNNELVRSGSVGGLPDLAVTRVHMEDGDGTVVNTILDNGAYDIVVRVTNFGADMTEAHMTDAGDGRVENLRIFDSNEPMETSSVTLEHFTSGDDPIQETADNFGILANGEYMVSTFTWDASSSNPRSLGIHTMNVKVIPVFSGEQNYRNNYVEKRFKVDKELTPLDIHGPDPGIYDIYFSNEAPNSGEEVTVTVIVQNSGDQPILAETGVNMVVTTWEPKKEHDSYSEPEIHDWRMDYEDHYGEWRSNNSEDVEITEDDTFPTCVRTNLELLSGAYLFFYFTLEARVDVPGGEQWVYAAIDPYNDNSKPQAIGYNPGGDDPGDNMRFGKIQVLPRILLVDDDEATTGSDGDMVSTVRESLVGAGVTLDKIFVAQQVSDNANTRDAPAFIYNQEEIAAPAMEDYDIVIWVTGSVKDPFTNIPNDHETNIGGNIQEIMKYLDSNRYLMVVGTDPFDGLMSYFGSGMTTDKLVIDDETDDASDFLYKYLGIEEVISDVDIPVEDPIRLYSMDILIDLQASIEEGNLIISHEKGDPLTGSETYINIYDDTGVPVETGTYSSYSGTTGEDWMSGSSVEVELSALSSLSTYDLEVTTSREYGTPIIVHRNQILTQDTGEEPELLYTDVYQGGIFSREDTIELLDQEAGNGGMNLFVPRGIYEADKFEEPVGILTNAEESMKDTPKYNTIRSFSTPDPDLFDASYRAVVMAWNVTQIKHLNEKVDLFSDILNWFDWEVEVGRDLAVTRMNLYILKEEESGWVNDPVSEDNSPKYLDTILIEAYVRNNGPNLESSSVMFYVTGPDGVELPITPNIPDPTNDLEPEEYDNPHDMNGLAGGGTEVSIYKLWLAVGVGTYTFRVVVDPFHLITEISEENNDISYSTSTVTSFITKNNILVVDDDMSDDNFPDDMDPVVMGERMIDYTGLGGEPSLVVEDTLTSLSYDFDQHLVKNDKIEGQWDYDSGLSILDLKRYNSILWVTGDSGEKDENARETFTDDDLEAIKRYLDGDYPEAKYLPEGHHENLMIIGSGFMDDLMVSNDPIQMTSGTYDLFDIVEGYFGVEAEAPGSLTGVSLRGPTDGRTTDKVYLGVDYGQAELDSSFAASSLSMLPDPMDEYADPVEGLWAEDAVGNSILVSAQYNYDNTGSTLADEKNFRVVLHSWQLTRSSSLSQESPLREMLYLPLHWFDTPEDEPELVGRSCKISVDTDNPVIGNSYVVQAEVANIGGVPGGGTVRFMDGSILVQSENIYMDPDTSTTIEAIWKPLYAGERTITVWIDRYNDYDEVFDTINNAPSITLDVYFFWDDMESGDGNWEHDSTVLRINGEGTLDYMAEPTYTNIEKEWGAMDGFHKNTDVANTVVQREFYSSPSSYYMYEPNLGGTSRKDIDLVMMLDTSGSMDDDGWDSSIGDDQPIGDMKIAAKNVVDQLTPDDRLALYTFSYSSPLQRLPFTYMTQEERESAKELIDDLSANGWTPLWDSVGETINYAVNHQRTTDVYTAAITLTDGDDYGSWGREDGSTVYCPGSEVGTSYDTCTWGAPTGLKWDDVDLDFRNQGTYNGDDVIRVGGGGASIDGSWLNLWDETRTGLIHAPIPVYTVGLGISPHEEDPLNPTIGSNYKFTSEYDLREIASTTNADYYYAPDSSTLDSIFQDIFQQVEQEAQASTRSGPTRGVGPWTDGDEVPRNKYIHTSVVDLQYADEAELSFKHKYNLKVGSNGGVVMIGTDSDGDGSWDFKYIQPDQPYTGNFLTSAWDTMLDSYGNKMRWCWNGLSGGGSLDWDHVTVDLSDFLGEEVIVAFVYFHLTGGTGYGWVLDDVNIRISTEDSNPNKDLSVDSWTLKAGTPEIGSYSGSHAWYIGDPNNGGDLKPGVDNSLYTRQIDLTNARGAILEAMFRFNIDTDPGRPPDGFRVEISSDNKKTWVPLNLGVRAAWGLSGSELDEEDGIPDDDKSYTGLDLEGNGNNWVPAGTLTRLNCDLAAFTGNVVNIRFRVTTNTDENHYADPESDLGIYIDDVFVYGTSLASSRNGGDVRATIDKKQEQDLSSEKEDLYAEEPEADDDLRVTGKDIPERPLSEEKAFSFGTGSVLLLAGIFIAAAPAAFLLLHRRRRNL